MVSYVQQEFAKLNSKNKLKIENLHDGRPWLADYKHWNYEAARRATEARCVSGDLYLPSMLISTCFL